MIPRILPVINEEKILEILNKTKHPKNKNEIENIFFFNSGRAALKFLFQQKFKNKKIGLQNFNCSVVEQAILESGNKPIYLDIDETYYSVSLENIKKEKIDVLILTHLFGIPNPNYFEIKEYCIKNNIILIHDLAQTVKAEVNNIQIEKDAEYYIYSFAFDKPIATLSGGLLKVPTKDYLILKKEYDKLKRQSYLKGYINIKLFYIYYKILSKQKFLIERTNSFLEQVIILLLPLSWKKIFILFYKLKLNIICYRIEIYIRKYFTSKIIIKRLSDIEQEYIIFQLEKYTVKNSSEIVLTMIEKIKKYGLLSKEKCEYSNIKISYGGRFPILVKNQDEFIKKMKNMNIECGNHNWGEVLSKNANTDISKKITKQIINMPIWSEKIWTKI